MPDGLPPRAQVTAARIRRAEATLAELRAEYVDNLAADDTTTQAAFLMYQWDVQRELDWGPEPVTWDHWWRLLIDSERDDYLQRAADLLGLLHQHAVAAAPTGLDVHHLPETADTDRQHLLARGCWCHPFLWPRLGGGLDIEHHPDSA